MVEAMEDILYGLIALFLIVGASVLLFSAARDFFNRVGSQNLQNVVVSVLDQALLVFMVAELLHTVRITLQERKLAAEPFLIVGLIAGVRRILILTAENEDLTKHPDFFSVAFPAFWVQMILLISLVLAMVISLYIWRKAYPKGEGKD